MFNKRIKVTQPRNLLFLFEALSLFLLFIYQWDSIERSTYITAIGLVIIIYISNFLLLKISDGDQYIFLIVTMLLSIGLIMIYRIDANLGVKQLLWLTLGILVFYLSYFILKYIKGWQNWGILYLGGSYLLFLLTFVLGSRIKGAINWIRIAGFTFQPAEITKLLLIFLIAAYYSNQEKYKNIKYSNYYLLGIVYSFIALLFLQRDLGMSVLFYVVYLSLQYIYEEDRKLIFFNIGLFIVGGLLGYIIFDHVKIRVITWLNPWPYIDSKGYQITQSLFAIAEGGFFGTGLGLGHPYFIPHADTDFIFSAICEEMGLFTGIGVIMLFLILVYRGFKIALRQNNKFYRILALGISVLFGIQSFVILGGVLKVIPLTGITLPFISYGGSSIISSFIALGILQVASEDLGLEDEYFEVRE